MLRSSTVYIIRKCKKYFFKLQSADHELLDDDFIINWCCTAC